MEELAGGSGQLAPGEAARSAAACVERGAWKGR